MDYLAIYDFRIIEEKAIVQADDEEEARLLFVKALKEKGYGVKNIKRIIIKECKETLIINLTEE